MRLLSTGGCVASEEADTFAFKELRRGAVSAAKWWARVKRGSHKCCRGAAEGKGRKGKERYTTTKQMRLVGFSAQPEIVCSGWRRGDMGLCCARECLKLVRLLW